MWKKLASCLVISIFSGCSTVTPDPIENDMSSPDSSTPPQYVIFTGGFIGFTDDGLGIVTQNARISYNTLIKKYGVQFKDRYAVLIDVDSGIKPYTDQYGNKLFTMDKEHLKYFAILKQWNRDNRPGDSLWLKFSDKITP